VDSLML